MKDIAKLLDEGLAKEVAASEPQRDDEITVKELMEATGLCQQACNKKLMDSVEAGTMTRRLLRRTYLYRRA